MYLIPIIKKIYSKWYNINVRIKSYIESRIIRIQTSKLEVVDKIHGRIIILAPHSDDEWVGCSQLLQEKDSHILIVNMDMMGGDSENLHRERYIEMLAMAKVIECGIVTITGDEYRKTEKLKQVIINFCPGYICVPFYYDWHLEHLLTRKILYDAITSMELADNRKLNIIEYQVSVPIPFSEVTHCNKMSKDEQSQKWKQFSDVYKTQEFFPIWRFKYNEYIAGKYCNCYSCENYNIKTAEVWKKEFDTHVISENQRIIIMESFKKLAKIRVILRDFEETISIRLD